MKIYSSSSLAFQEERSSVWINNPHFKQDYGYKWKTKSTSGYPFVTHLHTKAQPCFSPHPQLTPLPFALCGQTCTTLKKIKKKVGQRARQPPDRRFEGPVSALRRRLLSYQLSGSPLTFGVRWSPPGAWLSPQQVVSQTTWPQPHWNLPLHGFSCYLPLVLTANTAPTAAMSH